MRNTIMTTMQKWALELETQSAGDLESHDVFLDYKLLGVASFVKNIAYEHDDVELLAVASKIEMQVERLIKTEQDALDDHSRWQHEEYEREQQIREICIQHFYTKPAFHVDMSKYQSMIDDAGAFSDARKLASLLKYIDPDRALSKIYCAVKSRLRRYTFEPGPLPSFGDVESAYKVELDEIYRLADAHVPRVLTQYTVAQA